MNREQLFYLVRNQFGIEPDYPWPKFPENAVLRHANNRKWFGLVSRIPGEKLGLTREGPVEIINLKVRPELVGSLRQQAGIFPAWHMNKEHWITVTLEGPLSDEQIVELVNDSYALTR
ncbi:MmcQ/YjbR family DNA-binding protein [Cellvibrio polysaccharolyticus]|uniref:MmcQ/YjbR family DNA-binding protein n=1 Tax=Cellvibrio polysaccharolyticus TaxID=2082724 RepID=A0A928YS77_9GAMM|nr:MmcQ/YjbR family DNA-binding protein [Cellvibrio polysaccharolyticus]MBE8715724.1 MmcQ/YjbR family DNA-binding protein [Cellvibrio polysaccharolyticus]